MKAYRIYVGTGFDKNGQPLDSCSHDKRVAWCERELCRDFGGFTSWLAKGGYRHKDGYVVTEPSIVFEVFADLNKRGDVEISAKSFKYLFNQESVCLVSPEGEVDFI